MIGVEQTSLILGAIGLGVIHGVEPGHGWPVAATYALDQSNKWVAGFASSLVLGVGHLISSIAMVAVFFWAKTYFELTQINHPYHVFGFPIGGPLGIVAGLLLVALGIREYRHGHHHGHGHSHGESHGHGHSHEHGHGHSHEHGHDHEHGRDHEHSHDQEHGHSHDQEHGHSHDQEHSHDHEHGHSHNHDQPQFLDVHGDHANSHEHGDDGPNRGADAGLLTRVKRAIGFGEEHDHPSAEAAAERGIWGIAGFAFVLGFAHEEEFEIIAICLGTDYCLSLMLIYAATVIVGIVGLTLLLIAGYHRFESRVEGLSRHFPTISATILILMGAGFILGFF